MTWAVFIDRRYYPSLEGLYDTETEARAAADRLFSEESADEGRQKATIYIAQVVAKTALKTNY